MPGSSPYATSVGGTSMFANSKHSIKLQTGWGNNLTRVADVSPNPPIIPPLRIGFYAGSGGGTSGVWPNPSYQESLTGAWRLVPDIGYLADPCIVPSSPTPKAESSSFQWSAEPASRAPCFPVCWPSPPRPPEPGSAKQLRFFTRCLPTQSRMGSLRTGLGNVSGTIHTPHEPPVCESPQDLAAPFENTVDFVSMLYHGTSTRWYVIRFGTDTSPPTGPGWDNVTGLGTPNGTNFVTAVAAASRRNMNRAGRRSPASFVCRVQVPYLSMLSLCNDRCNHARGLFLL